MFGTNKVYTSRSYEEQEPGTLTVTSCFLSIQGEGPFAGRPAVFVRLTGCGFRCSFCDAYFDEGDILTFSQIRNRVEACILDHYKSEKNIPQNFETNLILVITGGEPFLQKNLGSFIEYMHNYFGLVQIESNGSIYREIPDYTKLVVSPKVNEKIKKYIGINNSLLPRVDYLKFVVSKTMEGYTDVPKWAVDWELEHPGCVYISPMNMYSRKPKKSNGNLSKRSEIDERISFWTPGLLSRKENKENHEYAAYISMKYGFNLSLQLHLYSNLP